MHRKKTPGLLLAFALVMLPVGGGHLSEALGIRDDKAGYVERMDLPENGTEHLPGAENAVDMADASNARNVNSNRAEGSGDTGPLYYAMNSEGSGPSGGESAGITVYSDDFSTLGIQLLAAERGTPQITTTAFNPSVIAGRTYAGTVKFRLLNWSNLDTEIPVVTITCNNTEYAAPSVAKLNTDVSVPFSVPADWNPGTYPILISVTESASNNGIADQQLGVLTVTKIAGAPAMSISTALTGKLRVGDPLPATINSTVTNWWPLGGDPQITFYVNGVAVPWGYTYTRSPSVLTTGTVSCTPNASDLSAGANVITASITADAYNNNPSAQSYQLATFNLSSLSAPSLNAASPAVSLARVSGTFMLHGWVGAMPTAALKVTNATVSNVSVDELGNGRAIAFSFDCFLPNTSGCFPNASLPVLLSLSGGDASKNSAYTNLQIGTVTVSAAQPTVSGDNVICAASNVSANKSVNMATAGIFTAAAPTSAVVRLHVYDGAGVEQGAYQDVAKNNASFSVSKNFKDLAPGEYLLMAEILANANNQAYPETVVGRVYVDQLVCPPVTQTIAYGQDIELTRTFALYGWRGELPNYTITMNGTTLASGVCKAGENSVTIDASSLDLPGNILYLNISGGSDENQPFAAASMGRLTITKNVARVVIDDQFVLTEKNRDIINAPISFTVENWKSGKGPATVEIQYLSEDADTKGDFVPIGTATVDGNGTYTGIINVTARGIIGSHQIRVACFNDPYNTFSWTIIGFLIFKGEPKIETQGVQIISIHKGESVSLSQVSGSVVNAKGRYAFWLNVDAIADGNIVVGHDDRSDTNYQFSFPLSGAGLAGLDYGAHPLTMRVQENTINIASPVTDVGTVYVNGLVRGNNDVTVTRGDTALRMATFALPGWCTMPQQATFKLGGLALTPSSVTLAANSVLRYAVPPSLGAGQHDLVVTLPDTATDKGYTDAKIAIVTIREPAPAPVPDTPAPTEVAPPTPTAAPTAKAPTAAPNTPTPTATPNTPAPTAAPTPAPAPSIVPGTIRFIDPSGLKPTGTPKITAVVTPPLPFSPVPDPDTAPDPPRTEYVSQTAPPEKVRLLLSIEDDDVPLGSRPVFASTYGVSIDEIDRLLSAREHQVTRLYSLEQMAQLFDGPSQMVLPFDESVIPWDKVSPRGYEIPLVGRTGITRRRDPEMPLDFDDLEGDAIGTLYMRPVTGQDEQGLDWQGYMFEVEPKAGVAGGTAGTVQVVRQPDALDMKGAQNMKPEVYDRMTSFRLGEFIPCEILSGKVILYVSVPCMYDPAVVGRWVRVPEDEETDYECAEIDAFDLNTHLWQIMEGNLPYLAAAREAAEAHRVQSLQDTVAEDDD